MTDVVSAKVRSRMMSGIRGKNTRPERLVRSLLHRAGYRFRINVATLPGKPDIVLPKYKAVIQVQGCFWHGHECHLFKWPSTRKAFWHKKILGNRANDTRVQKALLDKGWRLLVMWECALKGRSRKSTQQLLSEMVQWLKSSE